jgi:hypothetical protein
MGAQMTKKSNSVDRDRQWVTYAVLVATLTWAGLWGVTRFPVTDAAQVVFFALLFVAIASTVMPAVAYLNARFGKVNSQRTYRARFVRQSIWLGIFVVIVGWLQTRRMLTVTLALILMAVLALTETFLITREVPPRADY